MRAFLLTLSAVVLLALAACGGGDGDGGEEAGGGGEGRVEASAWTADVCGSVSSWLEDVEARSSEIGSSAQDAGSVEGIKRELVAFFDEMIDRTDRMVTEIERAGVPDVDDGDAIAEDFRTSMGPLREALADARDRAEKLPADDPEAFAQGAVALGEDVQNAGGDVQKAFDDLEQKYDTPELDQAFADEPACEKLENA